MKQPSYSKCERLVHYIQPGLLSLTIPINISKGMSKVG